MTLGRFVSSARYFFSKLETFCDIKECCFALGMSKKKYFQVSIRVATISQLADKLIKIKLVVNYF